MFTPHVSSQRLRKWSEEEEVPPPQSVCFGLTPLSPCSLYVTFPPAPPKATYIFFGDKGPVPESRWLGGSGPVAGPRHTEPPRRPTSCRPRHQRARRVREQSRTWFNPPVPFASQCAGTFPLLNPHFPPWYAYINDQPPPTPYSLLCPSHCDLTLRSHSQLYLTKLIYATNLIIEGMYIFFTWWHILWTRSVKIMRFYFPMAALNVLF